MLNNNKLFRFQEFNIPVPLLNMTGGGVDNFEAISRAHIALLRKLIQLGVDDHVLEIGCGIGRDAIPLTKILEPTASYTGTDLIKPSIEFCQTQISSRYPNFRFVHFDVKDKLHNPGGTKKMTDCNLPLDDGSVDKIFGWSVFTHMWENDIRHYLREFHRVLKVGGRAFLTCFILSPEIIAAARKTNLTQYNLRFEHQIDEHCFVNDLDFPLGAIGYSAEAMARMVEDSGLRFAREFVRGAWSGYYDDPEDGQDGIVLVRA